MKEFILVLSMWGFDGIENHYIGQVALQQRMSESQCEYMISESMWESAYLNENFHIKGHCFPAECAGEMQCEGGLEAWRNLSHSIR